MSDHDRQVKLPAHRAEGAKGMEAHVRTIDHSGPFLIDMTVTASRRLRICSWMFILAAVFMGSAALTDFVPNHAFDSTWPDHARFHLALAGSHLVTLSLLTILIAWFPFRKGRRWSWAALALVSVFGVGAIPVLGLAVGEGPPAGPFYVSAFFFLLVLTGLGFSWRPIFGGG